MARPRTAPPPRFGLIIWANIAKHQTLKGITDDDLSRLLGFGNPSTIKQRKNHSYIISADEMEQICALLGIEPERLFEK